MLDKNLLAIALAGIMCPYGALAQVTGDMSPNARAYLEHALDIMQAESINRATVDWSHVRTNAFSTAAAARTPRETHPAIREALEALGDNHSFFVPAERARTGAAVPQASARRLNLRVGYVRVPAFSGPNPSEFASQIRRFIQDVDGPGVCAWVVDVRGNGGGNMWPMLEGLLPILGEERAGYFVSPDGGWVPWEVQREPRRSNPLFETNTLVEPNPSVAVLHDTVTASSGEAVVVAFRGRPTTRSFGQSTRGLSTANRTFELRDGARMHLTVSIFADRRRTLYGGAIEPDQWVEFDTPEEEVFRLATDWLIRQAPCLG